MTLYCSRCGTNHEIPAEHIELLIYWLAHFENDNVICLLKADLEAAGDYLLRRVAESKRVSFQGFSITELLKDTEGLDEALSRTEEPWSNKGSFMNEG